MRSLALISLSFAVLAGAPITAWSDDAATTLPQRKAGLWEMKTTMDEGQGPRDQTMKMCIDETMEKNTVAASLSDHKSNCTTYNVKADGGKTVVDADCLYNGRQVVSTTKMSGDFKSAFEIDIASTTSDPEKKERTVVVKRTITQTGKFLGDSCGDLKGGEAQSADGTKMVVQ